jgi:secretion/DNA translocation related TadE-like protein
MIISSRGISQPPRSDPCTGQRGSGTLLIMLVVVVLLALAASFSVVGQYLVAGQRARAAADLAALAGAQSYGTGADGCAAAQQYATANGQRMADCSIVGDPTDFVLTVTITAPVPVRSQILPDTITVESHAGPVRR